MPPATPAQKRATTKHRAKRKRIELLLDPESPESLALDRLVADFGSAASAVRFAVHYADQKRDDWHWSHALPPGPFEPMEPRDGSLYPLPTPFMDHAKPKAAKPATLEPSSTGRRENQKPAALDLPVGPVPSKPGSRLLDKKGGKRP